MSEIATRTPGQVAVPEGARALGQRVKPIIRLGMGIKDPERRGAPKRTEYFTVRGDERAVAKFTEVCGEKPKAVAIMVPSELGLALDISYRSFIGGGDEDGGRPLALGITNFATLGFVGGPDVLRVWKQDGSYAEVETLGLDELGKPLDEIAKDLAIEVYATFTFTIPEVLGWGSFAAVTSKGKKSADNLAYKLGQIYSAFGSKAPFAFSREEPPMLVLKPDTAMMRFEDKAGKAKWGKTSIFVLDIVIPEAFDAMVDRLAERQAQIAPTGAAAALYPPALEAPKVPLSPGENGTEQGAGALVDEAEQEPSSSETDGAPAPATAEPLPLRCCPECGAENADSHSTGCPEEGQEPPVAEQIEEGSFTIPEGVDSSDEVLAADTAADQAFPKGKHKKLTLRQVADLGDEGATYIRYVLQSWDADDPFVAAAWAFAKIYLPDAAEFVEAKRKAATS